MGKIIHILLEGAADASLFCFHGITHLFSLVGISKIHTKQVLHFYIID